MQNAVYVHERIPKLLKISHKALILVLITCVFLLWHGCNSSNYSTPDTAAAPNRIVSIRVVEEDTLWNCIIRGDNPLKFSAINHIAPIGVVLYFPDTSLAIPTSDPISTANEIIESIEADEYIDENMTNSRIFIRLNVDRPYDISPDVNGLKISLPKTLDKPSDSDAIILSKKPKAAGIVRDDNPSASRLKTVTATNLQHNIIVNVNADGAITDYQSFTIDNPARIVFDIYNIESLQQGGQTITVDSKWVKRIRYFPYPDKLRLVLDTEARFLTKYFSFPTGSGLLIYVGQTPKTLDKKG